MSKQLAKLLKQQEELAAQIKTAELAAKNKNRIERMVVKLANKHQVLFLADPDVVEKNLDLAIAGVAAGLKLQ